MKKWILRSALALLAVGILAALLMTWLDNEPEIRGRSFSAWVDDLNHTNHAVREVAVGALREIGPEAVPYLSAELNRGSTRVQRAAESLAKHVPEFLKAPLRRIYSPSGLIIRKYVALHVLTLMGTNAAPAIPAVSNVLRGAHVGLSSSAAGVLLKMGTNGLPALIAALDDPAFDVRSAACHSLGSLRADAAPAIPRLARIVTEETGFIATSAATSLLRIGRPAMPVFLAFLSHTNAFVRRSGANGLAFLGPHGQPALPALLERVDDSAESVRVSVLQALARIDAGSPRVSAALVRALDDPHPSVRAAAVTMLTVRPRALRSNLGKLHSLLEDESAEVRAAAAAAIARVPESKPVNLSESATRRDVIQP